MTRSARTHYAPGDAVLTICGVLPSLSTATISEVSCRLCLGHIERTAASVQVERDRRGDHAPAVLEGPGQSTVSATGRRAIDRSIAGEPIDTGPRWGSVRAAMAALAMTQDARRSVASSSSPDRFGRGMGGDGGPAPTTPRETREDTIDLEMALRRACVPMQVGPHQLTAVMVRVIVEPRLLGRVVHSPVIGLEAGKQVSRKNSVQRRVDVSALEVAESSGLTRHQVGMVTRRVSAAIGEELARKGLIPARAAARERQRESESAEVEMAAVIGFNLQGWKSIAAHVGKSEAWCRERSQRETDPLPISRLEREVYARRDDVTQWLERQMRAAS
jgi:hypothetical protein